MGTDPGAPRHTANGIEAAWIDAEVFKKRFLDMESNHLSKDDYTRSWFMACIDHL